jgi:hypothetical protein
VIITVRRAWQDAYWPWKPHGVMWKQCQQKFISENGDNLSKAIYRGANWLFRRNFEVNQQYECRTKLPAGIRYLVYSQISDLNLIS